MLKEFQKFTMNLQAAPCEMGSWIHLLLQMKS